ncbi:MAG: 3-oxoacyl-[acyl-carrier-protein] synthase III C-terminal domain-containing protein [Dehalococcoidia bacterium]|nr:3-oxoacyl-[acyl-carrier-protein] synthase III C-terminal domain-containing protein [Dehalococcoidia bacterium]
MSTRYPIGYPIDQDFATFAGVRPSGMMGGILRLNAKTEVYDYGIVPMSDMEVRMVGIASYGAYVPILRLSRATIAGAVGGSPSLGERTVANFDEDSITMAVEASFDCLKGINKKEVDALYFASTTPPYAEKQCAALIAAVLDLDSSVMAADFVGSTRSGTIAMKAAMDSVKAGSARKVLVVAADCRAGVPGSDIEKYSGDGAAAVLIAEDGAVSIDTGFVMTDEFTFNWRKADDAFVRGWEERFIMNEGTATMKNAAAGIAKVSGVAIKDVTKAIIYGPNYRQMVAAAGAAGINAKTQLQGAAILDSIGNTGAAQVLMALTTVLEKAKAGESILMVNYGDGADAYLLKVNQAINPVPGRRGLSGFSGSKIMLGNYHNFLQLCNLVKGPDEGKLHSSLTALWRERKSVYACYGVKCKKCGDTQYPVQRVCGMCMAKDNFDLVCLAEKKGRLVTFTKEMGQDVGYPKVWSVVELEGGCRYFTVLTDVDPHPMTAESVDLPCEMTFRMFREAGGFFNYIWKCRPQRMAKEQDGKH